MTRLHTTVVSTLTLSLTLLGGGTAFAQSTGAIDFDEVVVTAKKTEGIIGIQVPDESKAKGVLTSENLSHGLPGNTVLNAINMLPGVSFQNNDPYGSSGGNLNIRGFGPDRISLTFDGVPLNDTGNYAIYPNQMLDLEVIEQVNVNMGSTDVDSPTAAASGGTVNYRSRNPYDNFGVTAVGGIGSFAYYRLFGAIDTGQFGPWNTKAYFAASRTGNDSAFNDIGKIKKQQYNAKVYQSIGDNGDFISIAGHFNVNRNNFFGSLPLRNDTTQSLTNSAPRLPGPLGTNRYPANASERFYSVANCTTNDVTTIAGTADPATTCGTAFDFRYNPSDTGNIRINSRFTLAQGLVLTVDPSYQYVKANGGGTVSASEVGYDWDPSGTPSRVNCATTSSGVGINCIPGYFGGVPYFGRDLNGDADLLDRYTVLAPSQTQTHRYGVISSLRYEINPQHSVRIAYTLDYGRHRQTGEVGLLKANGLAADPFPVDNPLKDINGNILEKRDRLSLAILNQVAGEYRGNFLDDALVLRAGLRAPFFTRDLTNNCFTSSAGGFVECLGKDVVPTAAILAQAPSNYAPPQNRIYHYSSALPNLGLTYRVAPGTSLYASYAKGMQVPGTDALYNAFYFPLGTDGATPKPETSDSFEMGTRYAKSTLQASASLWYTSYNNRIANVYSELLQTSTYHNLGKVEKYGVDASIAWQPVRMVTLYAFGSLLNSKIKDDLVTSATTVALTGGKREAAAPSDTLGLRAQFDVRDFTLGVQAKHTGKRYLFDTNIPVIINNPTAEQVYGAAAPAYALVDVDVRYSLASLGMSKSYAQLNVNNLFDTFYVGGFQNTLGFGGSVPNVQIGAPRAIMFSLHMQY